jgi:hypothetical protein
MLNDDTTRSMTRTVVNYRRGLFCPAELWGQVLGRLAIEDAEALLDRLPLEAQDVLRGAYRERPLSLRSSESYGEVRRVVEEWCQRG